MKVSDSDFNELVIYCNLNEKKIYVFFCIMCPYALFGDKTRPIEKISLFFYLTLPFHSRKVLIKVRVQYVHFFSSKLQHIWVCEAGSPVFGNPFFVEFGILSGIGRYHI